ncbi:PilZ domain-containing protein [Stutzerimonas azotifigens]|uniref:PilZ domain-containing protein n=1 Tax=Stutzerimonas azotifigens TaxID=291995 RepID=UPI00040E468D|nr:PilZ domain-containing protein [Stutzerimonas azotifigens]
MSTQDIEERREYYRIEDRIALEITRLEPAEEALAEEEAPPGFGLLAELHHLEFEAQHLLRQLGERNRILASYLKVQNRRLELLGQTLASHLLKDVGTPRPVILSEGGVRFAHDEGLPVGTDVSLRLVLLPQTLGLQLRAEIVHCQPREDGGFDLGAEFKSLSESQRQMLARHILQQQALRRRQSRETHQG